MSINFIKFIKDYLDEFTHTTFKGVALNIRYVEKIMFKQNTLKKKYVHTTFKIIMFKQFTFKKKYVKKKIR